MTGAKRTIRIEGQLYLSLELVAETYEFHAHWLREAYERGLLGSGVEGETACIAAAHLERVARVVRLHRVLGGDLDAVARALQELA